MTVRDVLAAVEDIAPKGFAYEWDRVGLRIGESGARVKRVLCTLSVTREVFERAKKLKADCVVAHHSPIWDPLKTLDLSDPDAKLWVDFASAGIACVGAHTNLDVAPGGVNDVLADRIGIVNRSPLFPTPHVSLVKIVTFVPESHVDAVRDAMAQAGAGVIGDYTHCSFTLTGEGTYIPGEESNPFAGKRGKLSKEMELRLEMQVHEARQSAVVAAMCSAHPYEEVAYDVYPMLNRDPEIGIGLIGELEKAMSAKAFASHVLDVLDAQHVRVAGPKPRSVKKVAVMGGAGGSQIGKVPAGVDAFVTGDVGYHEAQLAEARGLYVVDAGHNPTERWVVPVLAKELRKRLSGVNVSVYNEPNPFTGIVK